MISKHNAYILGYAWGATEKALGDYDPTGELFEAASKNPMVAFGKIQDVAFHHKNFTENVKDTVGNAISELDLSSPIMGEIDDVEVQMAWRVGAYRAKAGKPMDLSAVADKQTFDIAAARKAIGMSQLELANAVGVSQTVVSRWESGKMAPSEKNAQKLKEILG